MDDGARTRLIVTADDFGISRQANAAIERAHRDGILTAASLMVAAPAAAEAVEIARRNPRLGVGLHLVLVDGAPALPPANVPDLAGADGRFRPNMALQGARFLLPHVRRQLAAEITAQFEAFAATDLRLDHVNAHKHFHVHPVIAGLILRIGPRFGMRAVRAPIEPPEPLAAIEPAPTPLSARLATAYARRLRARLRAAGLAVPDAVFGLRWTGHMTLARVQALLDRLPSGLIELYAHPATGPFPGLMAGADAQGELEALLHARPPGDVQLTTFSRCA
ncbi:MAG: hopanoid biosynthesis-associated protein HpnK [Sphingomonadaceae bacterium]|nr:hopanoid biosynthesis-associated protein HpnK [Sphingomonadaceae bacterium]